MDSKQTYFKRRNRFSENITTHNVVSSVVKSNIIKINTRLENKIYVCINGVDTTKFYTFYRKNNDSKFVIGCVANFGT